MSNRLTLWILAACTLSGSGCTLVVRGARNIADEFCDCVDERREAHECRAWARQCWERVCRCGPGTVYTEDYAAGFESGFVSYVWHGGSGEPPPLPPSKYRAARYRTVEGYRAIEQWFAGYRHGVTVARESGYRRLVTGPSSLPVLPAASPPGSPAPVPLPAPAPVSPAPNEELPAPRTVPSSPGEVPPSTTDPAVGTLVPVPFEVSPAADEETGALVPVPFDVRPVANEEPQGPTDKPEG